MNILKRSIAPITEKGWKEIIDQSARIFRNYLSAREFVDIDGPNGFEQGGVSTGKLIIPENQSNSGIKFGLREVIPLVEIRKPFELDIWEIDNINRGAKKINLEALESAAKEVALFEESAIYHGFQDGAIKGLEDSSMHPSQTFPDDPDEFLRTIGDQIVGLKKAGVEGPYTLIVNENKWQDLLRLTKGYPIVKQLEQILKGQILITYSNKNVFLISERGGDFELTLGQDISIGYESHDAKKVKLYFTESFTFRVIAPEAIRVLKPSRHQKN